MDKVSEAVHKYNCKHFCDNPDRFARNLSGSKDVSGARFPSPFKCCLPAYGSRHLPLDEGRKQAVLFHELVEGAAFRDLAPVEDQDAVGAPDGRQAMGDDDSRHFQAVETVRHDGLGAVVEGAGGFVADDDRGLHGKGLGNQDALPLAARDVRAALADHGLHLHRHLADLVGDARRLSSRPCVVQRQIAGADDVAVDVPGHQLAVLQHDAHLRAHRREVEIGEVLPVVIDRPAGGRLEAEKQTHQRRFSAAGASDDGHMLSRRYAEAYVMEHFRQAFAVGKG